MASYLFLCLFLFFPHLYASFSSSGSHSCSSLTQFKNSFSITQTEGASLSCNEIAGLKSYPKTNSWKEGTDCCSWDGVTCDHLNAHVIALDLSCSWLYGNFPPNTTLFLLPHLQKLNLAYNDFNLSKIPSEFGGFTSLFYLNLSHTGFAGQVPSQVSHLSKLGLVHNLSEVRHLFLDGMDMSSVNAHVFMNLSSSLRSLSLAYCDLQGKFPKNIFDLPNLNLLNLGSNPILSLDPLKLNRSSNLEHLDLSSMSFSTEFIDSVDNLQALKYLDLSGHFFSQRLSVSKTKSGYLFTGDANFFGGLPHSMGNLVSLKFLDLSYSNLSGTVPRSLGNLLQLTHLDLSGNQFSGQIPSSILNLTQLEYLKISENSLEGSIPDEVTAFPNLIYLYLDNNLLNGILPSWFGHIKEFQSKSLELIWLENNKLQGPLPSSIFQLLNLTGLHEFPQFLKGLKSLESLDLSCNKIEGKIPQWMQEHFPWNNIAVLDLSSNLIRGNLPIPASTIRVFLISNNSFNGEVSSLICNATYLQILDLSHNYLSGSIPKCFGNLSYWLEFLNLKKNKFYGTIPPAFAKGCQLSNFNLNGNLLEGPLTPSILNCRGLEVLDLGNNKINDTFPHWLGSLPFLQVLVLKAIINLEKIGSTMSYMGVNCPGSGFYTYSIGIVMKGQDMDLVKIFTMWMIIDLSNNQFEGVFQSLEWLDLSSNRLSGTIPNRLADLPFLSSFNVSENKLHGQIPQGKQFNTFGNDSYEGNKGLCGFPVSKGCNIIEPPPLNVLEKDGSKSNITFGWKVVLIGYGCGVVFGMSVGYVVFQTGKPKWLKRRRKSKDGSRRNGRRRI
ncbi:hypothetical protein ERO13_D05G376232v2 [Gossypium hirsutum]|nr:hypothetical protein ERO13_D05G376232v2 [Gossypium hirsutum]